jgi:hypothetical protein
VREYNKIEDEEIRDKFYSLMMSVSKKIQIDKEKENRENRSGKEFTIGIEIGHDS